MQEYYFLFALALLWTIFAAIQDIKKREVANWLNFSLLAFALAYRLFYAISTAQINFFLYGIAGAAVCYAFALAFYYSKTFAGGDAKLLIAYGAILPYENFFSTLTNPILFIALLLATGAIYTLFYTIAIAVQNKQKFKREFKTKFKKNIRILIAAFGALILSLVFFFRYPIIAAAFVLLLITPFLYIYLKSIEFCTVVLLSASKLTEGDWLEKAVTIGKIKIQPSVHGLSKKEIQLLRKHNKKVFIKQGVPFVPAFLLALIITLFFSLNAGLSLRAFLSLF